MTNKEAIKYIQEDCAAMCICLTTCENCGIYLGMKALEKAEKYKWHDLRKNPEDLPTKPRVLAARKLSTGTVWYEVVNYGIPSIYPKPKHEMFFADDSGWGDTPLDDIIAWKYIEEFEG